MELEAHIDGGARGNPGPAAAAVVLCRGGQRLLEAAYFLGRQTNNHAEYTALIFALRLGIEFGAGAMHFRSDSELLVRQMTGEYRVRNPALAALYAEAQALLLRIGRWSIQHVRREQNRRADQLVNLALDRGADVIEFDARPGPHRRPDLTAAPAPQAPPAPANNPESPGAAVPIATPFQPGIDGRLVRVLVTAPSGDVCAARLSGGGELLVGDALPAGLCLHAAHALLPTLLALHGMSVADASNTPVMTLRCMRGGCGAVFQLSVSPSPNGHPPANP